MGNKAVRLNVNRKTLTVDDMDYKLTPGLLELITIKHPRREQYNPMIKKI